MTGLDLMISLGILSLSSAFYSLIFTNEYSLPSAKWNIFGLNKLELNSSVSVFHWQEIKEKELHPL